MNPGDVLGNYRIVRLLGQGGMGAVYEAVHETIERRVALKLLHTSLAKDREAVNRFFNEARATNRIDHPSIVQVSDFGHAPDGASYLVMEFLRGVSLAKRIADLNSGSERMEVATALQIAWQVADALTVAHTAGIVHRDLKPENLMLVDDPIAPSGERVKILDFGIAKLSHSNTFNKAHTAVNALMGTPVYMSPEQCEGAGGVDDKSDVYSLGVILYEMLAGRPPFVEQGMGQLLLAHMTISPPPLTQLAPQVPKDVADCVHRLLTKAKADRPSMQQVHNLLSDLLINVSGSVPAIRRRASAAMGQVDAPSRRSQRPGGTNTLGQSLGQKLRAAGSRPASIAGVALVVVGLGLVSFLGFRGQRRPATTQQPITAPQDASTESKTAAAAREGAASPVQDAKKPVPVVEPKAAAAPVGPRVQWAIDSEPSGADVLDAQGTVLGRTPWMQERPRDAGQTALRLQKKGFEVLELSLPNDQDSRRSLPLVSAEPSVGTAKKKQKKKKKGLEIED